MNIKNILMLWIGLTGMSSLVMAEGLPYAVSPMELSRLPQYCAVRMKADMRSSEYQQWQKRIGENFVDFLHFCSGINFINRYWGARSSYERNYYLQNALGEFDYMVRAEKPDFALRAELYSYRGEVLRLMGKTGEAIKDFNKALTIDPKMVKVYEQLADLHLKAKEPARALEAVTEGLRHAPDSRGLQRRYGELGGKKPYPEPYAARKEESAESAQEKAVPPSANTENAPSPAIPNQASAKEASGAGGAADPKQSGPAGPSADQRKNPWCRFCPDESN